VRLLRRDWNSLIVTPLACGVVAKQLPQLSLLHQEAQQQTETQSGHSAVAAAAAVAAVAEVLVKKPVLVLAHLAGGAAMAHDSGAVARPLATVCHANLQAVARRLVAVTLLSEIAAVPPAPDHAWVVMCRASLAAVVLAAAEASLAVVRPWGTVCPVPGTAALWRE